MDIGYLLYKQLPIGLKMHKLNRGFIKLHFGSFKSFKFSWYYDNFQMIFNQKAWISLNCSIFLKVIWRLNESLHETF